MSDWQQTSVHKPGPIPKPGLGQVSVEKVGRRIPLSALELGKGRHATCVEHLEVEGLREPLCIARGQDREEARRFALRLARGGQ